MPFVLSERAVVVEEIWEDRVAQIRENRGNARRKIRDFAVGEANPGFWGETRENRHFGASKTRVFGGPKSSFLGVQNLRKPGAMGFFDPKNLLGSFTPLKNAKKSPRSHCGS